VPLVTIEIGWQPTAEEVDALPAGPQLNLLVWEALGFTGGMVTPVSEWWRCLDHVIEHMERTHHWRLLTPFAPGDTYWAGLTAQGWAGWNGRPGYQSPGTTLMEAVCRVAVRCVRELAMPYDGLATMPGVGGAAGGQGRR